jgi:endonuclease G
MSPQNPSFNRGIWKKLEEKTREWAKIYDSIYIIVGPVLNDSLPTIGPNKISVPKYYYKVILDYRKNHSPKAIGFIFENMNSSLSIQHFVVPIDKIEQLTHLDFFHQLPDSVESSLEKETCLSCWEW